MTSDHESQSYFQRQKLIRVYVSGFILLAMLYLCWRLLDDIWPWFSGLNSPPLAILLAFLTLLITPPMLGCFVIYVINPILGKWNTWSELMTMQDRLVGELASDRNATVVLVNSPLEKNSAGVGNK